jgi:hypothetical protein
VKRRWKIVLGAGGVLFALALAPIVTIETTCRSPIEGLETAGYRPLLKDPAWQRDETRTWLTYPEWHIVYSAESFARFLANGSPPSHYHYLRDVRGFWSGYCAMNQATAGRAGADSRVMLYTIGLSYSAELLAKAAYENTLGRIAEWLGGWTSADDRYAARVQQSYGAFMHETPWYEFPFGAAFSGLWRTSEPHALFRHWERRLALSGEYGVKTGYAKLIGLASGASLGRDERTLRFVVDGTPQSIRAVDRRLTPVANLGRGLTAVEAPRYEQFTQLLLKLANKPVELVEISGNDDIYLTLLMPPGAELPGPAVHLLTTPVDEAGGWRRVGLSAKVPELLGVIRQALQQGGRVEHVYDY